MKPEVLDVEIEMHAFRLLRGGNFKKASSLVKEIERAFPEIPAQRIKKVMARMCDRLIDNGS